MYQCSYSKITIFPITHIMWVVNFCIHSFLPQIENMGISKIDQHVINRVKAKREELNWTQDDLADALGVSKGLIGNIESPKYVNKYSLAQINKLAKIFKCTIWDIIPEKPM